MDTIERLEHLKKLRAEAKLGGGQKRIDKLHSLGRLTARERIDLQMNWPMPWLSGEPEGVKSVSDSMPRRRPTSKQ